LAGLPASVIARAKDILGSLEHDELARGGKPSLSGAPAAAQQQLGLFQAPVPPDDKLRERIREIDINRTTPLDALRLLEDLKKELDG
jgi:DNA mismatch repair protein MutS